MPEDLKMVLSCIAHRLLMPPFPLQLTTDSISPTKEQQNWYEFTPSAEKLCSQAQQAFSLTHARAIKLGLTALLRHCGGGSCCRPFFFCQSCQAETALKRKDLPCDISNGKQSPACQPPLSGSRLNKNRLLAFAASERKARLPYSQTATDTGKQTYSLRAKRSSPPCPGIPTERKGVMLV